MKTSCPVDGNVAFASIQSRCTLHTSTSADSTELEQSVEDRTIVTNVVFPLLFGERIHVVWRYFLKKVDVLVGVELGHFMTGGGFCTLQRAMSQWDRFQFVPLRSSHRRGKAETRTEGVLENVVAYVYLHLLVYTIVHY